MSADFFLADDFSESEKSTSSSDLFNGNINFYELRKSTSSSNLSAEIEFHDISASIDEQINFFLDLCASLDIKAEKVERKKYSKCDLQYHTINFLLEDINLIINNITYVVEFSNLYHDCKPSDHPAGWDRAFYFYVENLTATKCKIYYQYSFNVNYYIELSNKFKDMLTTANLDYEEKIFYLVGKPGEKYMSFTLHDFSEKSCDNFQIYINALKEGLHKSDKHLRIYYYFELNDSSYLTSNFTLHFTDIYFIRKYDRR